ncbi:MAG: TonB-dependent receptor, partial [Muribaculaceae bacterium]|nr:TonB-dependent receptor [Muribaculaceae bacterium]
METQQLSEIVVKAPRVVRKADMDMFYPSESAVEHSKDGVQLLRNLLIPSLDVNDVLGTITTSGQSVQVRINGREATIDQVRGLLPESIKRVEWIDNPGLRYNGANAVLNFIVSNPDAGGSLMTQG